MNSENIVSWTGLIVGQKLRGTLQGQVVLPGDENYPAAKALWNGAIDHHPALIARCETREDVQSAVRAARAYGLALSVRGGGHDWSGRAMRQDGLVIDLSAMRQVTIDAGARTATIGGGATAHDVLAAAAPHGLVAVTGNCGTVGMAGLSLGGGYGLLSGKYGLAADNILGAELVLADGKAATATADENAELFWALRGGGGNFGVVTSLHIRLHRVESVTAGMMLFPWSQAETLLHGFADIAMSAPDEFSLLAVTVPAPDGTPALCIAPAWCGNPDAGTATMAKLQRLGTALVTRIGATNYADLIKMFDAVAVPGRHYEARTRWLAKLSSEAVTAMRAAVSAQTSPFSMIALHYFHGAPARMADAATPFGLRREHFMAEIIACWEPRPNENGASHRLWAQNLCAALAPYALPGGYPNFLGSDDRNQIEWAYGDNLNRLQRAKDRFDPGNVFSATPMPARIKQADDQPAAFNRA